jgi:hypothetical protein
VVTRQCQQRLVAAVGALERMLHLEKMLSRRTVQVRPRFMAAVLACLCVLAHGPQTTAVPTSAAAHGLTYALPLFDPSRSSSVNMEMSLPLRVHYADANTELSGVVCRDDVRLGEYKGRVAFACWTNAPNEMFWARMGNGVLGLAPRYQKQHDEDHHPLPPPMLLGLTAPNAKDSNVAGLPPRFSFMASKTAAELQVFSPRSPPPPPHAECICCVRAGARCCCGSRSEPACFACRLLYI